MSQVHLTDDQLQDFLDGNIPESDPVAEHLESCPRCQKALATYKSLYSAMENVLAVELSPDFADAVMDRLPERALEPEVITSTGFQLKDSMVLFIAVAAVIAAGIYFISPDLIVKPFASLFESQQIPESQFLNNVRGFFSGLNINAMMIVFIALTFAGIGAVDRIIAHRRHIQKPVSFLI